MTLFYYLAGGVPTKLMFSFYIVPDRLLLLHFIIPMMFQVITTALPGKITGDIASSMWVDVFATDETL